MKDTGIGISPETIEAMFGKFEKGNTNGTKLYAGAGLGLTISKKIADLLNGKIKYL